MPGVGSLRGRRPRPGRGPQRRLARDARRRGSRSSTTTSCPPATGAPALVADLAGAAPATSAASRARLRVPLPARPAARPTGSATSPGLERARWAPPTWPTGARRWRRSAASTSASRAPTARTPTSALRVTAPAGGSSRGDAARSPTRCGRPTRWVSLRQQAGNADDALMRRLHGRGLARRAPARRRGRLRRHVATVGRRRSAAAGRSPRGRRGAARPWPAPAGRPAPPSFAWARIAPGPARRARGAPRCCVDQRRDPARRGRGTGVAWRAGAHRPRRGRGAAAPARGALRPRRHAGRTTSPTTATPTWCEPVPGAARGAGPAARARASASAWSPTSPASAAGCSAASRSTPSTRGSRSCSGRSTPGRSARTRPDDGCACRKPAPGHGASGGRARSASTPSECVVIGDIGADVEAAAGGRGARACSCPRRTRAPRRCAAAPDVVARDLRRRASTRSWRGAAMTRTSLVVRLDNDGDVLLAGPAVRAVAAGADRSTLLCGPRGPRRPRAAARRRRGRSSGGAPWIDPTRRRSTAPTSTALVDALARPPASTGRSILTSFHQSPLPTGAAAAAGRRAADRRDQRGLPRLAARRAAPRRRRRATRPSARCRSPRAAGLRAAAGRRRRAAPCAGRCPTSAALPGRGRTSCVHPGASVPARAWARRSAAAEAARCSPRAAGGSWSPAARASARCTAQRRRRGRRRSTSAAAPTLAELAAVLAAPTAVVVGNTGPAHLAAAVGTPVVSLFAPTVPAERWAPVPGAARAARRPARRLPGHPGDPVPVPGHPCLTTVRAEDVLRAVEELCGSPRRRTPAAQPGASPWPSARPVSRGGERMRIAMVSEHASPLAALGGVDAGGQNVHVAALAGGARAARRTRSIVHTRRDDRGLPERGAAGAGGVDVDHVPAGPAARRAQGRAAASTCRRSPTTSRAQWADGARPTSCTRTSGCSGLARAASGRASRRHAGACRPSTRSGTVKRRHQGDARHQPREPDRARARHRARRSTASSPPAPTRSFELLRAWAPTAAALTRRPVRRGPRRSSGPTAPPAARGAGPAAGCSCVGPAGRAQGRRQRRSRRWPTLPDAELRRRRRTRARAAGRRPGGAAPARAGRASSASATGWCFAARVEPRRRCPRCCARPTSSSRVPWYEPFGIVPLEAMACGVPGRRHRGRRPARHRRRRRHRRAACRRATRTALAAALRDAAGRPRRGARPTGAAGARARASRATSWRPRRRRHARRLRVHAGRRHAPPAIRRPPDEARPACAHGHLRRAAPDALRPLDAPARTSLDALGHARWPRVLDRGGRLLAAGNGGSAGAGPAPDRRARRPLPRRPAAVLRDLPVTPRPRR